MNTDIFSNLTLPVIAAPMFLVSGVELVVACCSEGVVGSFPALNQRTSDGFRDWLTEIEDRLETAGAANRTYGVNLIVHRSNPRVRADIDICVEKKVPLVITSLGAVKEVVDAVHSYGGKVFHDVTNARHAEKALEAGADGLVLVANGAGGHGGLANPFALLAEIRRMYDGYIALAGSITNGAQIAAACVAGADFAYIGTRFIATRESYADLANKQMIVDSKIGDIVYTNAFSGVHGNFMRQSILDAGLDPDNLPSKKIDFGKDLNPDKHAWKDIWSAGHGVSDICEIPTTAELIAAFKAEYAAALNRVAA